MKLLKLLCLPLGLLLLALAIILDKFANTNHSMDYTIGFLFGLASVLNLVYIILVIVKRINRN